MNNALDENAKLDVEINNLRATNDELEKLKDLIVKGLGSNGTSPTITLVSIDAKGELYEVRFKVLNPKNFKLETVKDWLHSITLVGWRVDGTFVR